jgi:hypothetical protein
MSSCRTSTKVFHTKHHSLNPGASKWVGSGLVIRTFVVTYVLKHVRIEPEKPHVKKQPDVSIGNVRECESSDADEGAFNLPFTAVDLTFEKLVYEVTASTSNETLRLLNEVSGAFLAGRMVALMG